MRAGWRAGRVRLRSSPRLAVREAAAGVCMGDRGVLPRVSCTAAPLPRLAPCSTVPRPRPSGSRDWFCPRFMPALIARPYCSTTCFWRTCTSETAATSARKRTGDAALRALCAARVAAVGGNSATQPVAV